MTSRRLVGLPRFPSHYLPFLVSLFQTTFPSIISLRTPAFPSVISPIKICDLSPLSLRFHQSHSHCPQVISHFNLSVDYLLLNDFHSYPANPQIHYIVLWNIDFSQFLVPGSDSVCIFFSCKNFLGHNFLTPFLNLTTRLITKSCHHFFFCRFSPYFIFWFPILASRIIHYGKVSKKFHSLLSSASFLFFPCLVLLCISPLFHSAFDTDDFLSSLLFYIVRQDSSWFSRLFASSSFPLSHLSHNLTTATNLSNRCYIAT